MASTDALERAGRYLQAVFDDDDLRKQLRDVARSGGKLSKGVQARRTPPPQTLVSRAGDTLRASSGALTALRQVEPEPEPSRRGRTAIALLLAAGLVAAVAAQDKTNQSGGTHGV